MPKKPLRTATSRAAKTKPGPKPDTLKLEGNWEENVSKSFQKKKPSRGWPK